MILFELFVENSISKSLENCGSESCMNQVKTKGIPARKGGKESSTLKKMAKQFNFLLSHFKQALYCMFLKGKISSLIIYGVFELIYLIKYCHSIHYTPWNKLHDLSTIYSGVNNSSLSK